MKYLSLLVSKVLAIALVSSFSCFQGFAQSNETEPETEESSGTSKGVKRISNLEYIIGIGFNSTTYDGQTLPTEFGESFGESTSHTGVVVGVGAHLPLVKIDQSSTLWLVPALQSAIFVGSNDPTFGIEIPVHVTYGIGALRRKSSAWGVEGGLGVNFRNTDLSGEIGFKVVPSVLVDFSYAPKNVYRIRLMSDILATSLTSVTSYRQFSIALVIGM